MKDVFNFKNLAYNFRNAETLNRGNVSSVKYGTEKITSLRAKNWKTYDDKELTSLSTCKSKIKQINALANYQNIYPASWLHLTGHCYVRSKFV